MSKTKTLLVFLVLFSISVLSLSLNQNRVLNWVVNQFVSYPVEWSQTRFSNPFQFEMKNVQLFHPLITIHAENSSNQWGLAIRPIGFYWKCRLNHIRITSKQNRFSALEISSGQISMHKSLEGLSIRLKHWHSQGIEVSGVIGFFPKGILKEANLTGTLSRDNFRNLARDTFLESWVKDTDVNAHENVRFDVRFENEVLAVHLDGKPFLKSRFVLSKK